MRKKILGIIAILLVMIAVVLDYSFTTKKDSSNCANHPGCICPKPATEQTAATKADAKDGDNCPNKGDCSHCSK